jgi:hypothetical protein
MILNSRFGELSIIPGESWHPLYRAREVDGTVVDFAWFCPHCGREYKNRKSCNLHCSGKIGMFVAVCPYLPIHQCSDNCKRRWHPQSKYAIHVEKT